MLRAPSDAGTSGALGYSGGHAAATSSADVDAVFSSAAQSVHYSKNYAQERVLGRGRAGTAVLLRSVSTGEHVVTKQIPLASADDGELARVKQEVRLLKSMTHPHIIEYVDCFSEVVITVWGVSPVDHIEMGMFPDRESEVILQPFTQLNNWNQVINLHMFASVLVFDSLKS